MIFTNAFYVCYFIMILYPFVCKLKFKMHAFEEKKA